MCDPVQDIADIAAIALAPETGGASLDALPLINGGVKTGEDLLKGKSLSTSLGQGVLSGVETLGGQELGGATGIGGGNSAFNDALGITGDTPLGTGLPDIGGGISDAAHGVLSSAKDFLGGSATGGATGGAVAGATPFADSAGTASSGAAGAAPVSSIASAGSILGASGAGDAAQGAVNSQLGGAPLDATSLGSIGTDLGSSSAPASAGTATATNNASSWLPSKGSTLGAGLSLAPAALAAIQGPPKLSPAAQTAQPTGTVSAPLIATEQQQLAQGNSGTLSPSQQAGIDLSSKNAENALIQQLASSGVTDYKNDSRYIKGMQDIQQQALAQQQQYVQQALTNGFTAGGAAAGNLQTAATEQSQNDQAYQDAINKALEAAGSVLGGQKAA